MARGYAYAPNSPHKKMIFGRINRAYIGPQRASDIVDNHLDPLMEEYALASELASAAAQEGNYGEFGKYFKTALQAYSNYHQLYNMITHSEAYAKNVDKWKEKYAAAVQDMHLTEEDKRHRAETGNNRVDLDNFNFHNFSTVDKAAVLRDIKLMAREIHEQEDCRDNGGIRTTNKYDVIIQDAERFSYTGDYDYKKIRQLRRKQEKREKSFFNKMKNKMLQKEDEFVDKMEQKYQDRARVAKQMNGNYDAWEKYDKEFGNSYDSSDYSVDREDKSHHEDEQQASQRDTKKYRSHSKHNKDEQRVWESHFNNKNEKPVMVIRGAGYDKDKDKKSVDNKDGTEKSGNRHKTRKKKNKFGEKIYNTWDKVPVVGRMFSPYSSKRHRIGPFVFSTGLKGMRHPLDFISNVSFDPGPFNYAIYSRDYERGFTYFDLPGGIDLRGKRKKKKR